jgi:hypothetical protein
MRCSIPWLQDTLVPKLTMKLAVGRMQTWVQKGLEVRAKRLRKAAAIR